jgi:hypothetical protein
MPNWDDMPEKGWYRCILALCLILSGAGIWIAIHVTKDSADGARGGAVAVGVALISLFLSRDYGARIQRAVSEVLPTAMKKIDDWRRKLDKSTTEREADKNSNIVSQINGIRERVSGIEHRLTADAEGQKVQNFYLALATAAGTFFWAFGDVVAKCLIPVSVPPRPLTVATTNCIIRGLPESGPQVAETDRSKVLERATQFPIDCLDFVIQRALHDEPILVLIEGRGDKRPLGPGLRRIYGDNFTLAYQRGLSLKIYLIEHYRSKLSQNTSSEEQVRTFSSRIVVTAGGPNHIDADATTSDISDDRSVEVFSYWNTSPNP